MFCVQCLMVTLDNWNDLQLIVRYIIQTVLVHWQHHTIPHQFCMKLKQLWWIGCIFMRVWWDNATWPCWHRTECCWFPLWTLLYSNASCICIAVPLWCWLECCFQTVKFDKANTLWLSSPKWKSIPLWGINMYHTCQIMHLWNVSLQICATQYSLNS